MKQRGTKNFLFKTGGPLYFSFTECEKASEGYSVLYTKNPKGTCIFPSELKPWEITNANSVNPQITSEQTVCIFEVGFDDKNVFTGNIRKTEGGNWGNVLNTKMKNMDSALDCFALDGTPSNNWKNAVIIGLW